MGASGFAEQQQPADDDHAGADQPSSEPLWPGDSVSDDVAQPPASDGDAAPAPAVTKRVSAEPLVFDGPVAYDEHLHHNKIDPSFSWSAPTLAAASMLGSANAHGSPAVRRRARVLAWLLLAFVAFPLIILAVSALTQLI